MMKLTISELYVARNALLARKEWIDDEGEGTSPEELPHITSLLQKLDTIQFYIEEEE